MTQAAEGELAGMSKTLRGFAAMEIASWPASTESPLVHLQMLGNWALGRGFDLPDLDVHRPTLEEVYLSLTSPVSAKDQR